MAKWGARTFPLLGIILILASLPSIPNLAAYLYTYPYIPPYTYPPPFIITVHTTTIVFSGPPTTNFDFDVQGLDNLSFVTRLIITTSSPLSNFVMQIFQLNAVPFTIRSPSGRLLLVFQFNIEPAVERNITFAEFFVRVPQLELQDFSVLPNTLQVQRLKATPPPGSWTPISTVLNNIDATNVYLAAYSTELSLFAVTGTVSSGITLYVFIALSVTITASGTFLLSRRRRRARIVRAGRNWPACFLKSETQRIVGLTSA